MKTDRQQVAPLLVLLGAVSIVMLINPVGFIGGDRDDGRYLEAARCWVDHGFCLPTNHWQGRWPVFAPVAFLISLFGESRAVVQLWPLACSIAALLIFIRIVERQFGTRVGVAASLLLLFSPAFAIQLLRPNVETIELSLVLCAVACILAWRDRPNGWWAFAAGLAFGLAFQVRETSIAAAIIAVGAMFGLGLRPKLLHLAYAAIGFALPLAAEFLIYQITAGDWLYRRRLSLSHATIPSGELPASVDRTRSPILNPDYIANWRRAMGIQVHWLIDGALNLLINPGSGLSLLIAPILLLASQSSKTHARLRVAWWLLALAAIYFAFLTYILAVDPKPRIMLFPLALGSVSLAMTLASLLHRGSKSLVIAVSAAVGLSDIIFIATAVRMGWADHQARIWIAQYPHAIETNDITRSILTLNADVRSMPDFGVSRPFVMIIADSSCREWLRQHQQDPMALSVAGEKRLNLVPDAVGPGTNICLFRKNSRAIPAHS